MKRTQEKAKRRTSKVLLPEQVAILTGADTRTIELLVSLELITPCKTRPRPVFHEATVPRLRKMLRLHHDLEVNWSHMDLVMDLLDRIEELERRLTDS